MQSQNKGSRKINKISFKKFSEEKINEISYLASYALLLSYLEFFIPRPLPFLRLGLSNAVILYALSMDFSSLFLLCIIKTVCSAFISGTFFSPFFLISFSQSLASALAMYSLNFISKKIFKDKLFSLYGISLFGSAISAIVQILLCTIYLGLGTIKLMGIMLFFSIFSGIITAYLSQKLSLQISTQLPLQSSFQTPKEEKISSKTKVINLLKILFLVIFSLIIFLTNKLLLLIIFFILSFLLQFFSKKKLNILPHIFMWAFVFITGIFIPNGKIFFYIGNLAITKGALVSSAIKSLKLSSSMALSQVAVLIPIYGKGIISKTIKNFQTLVSQNKFTKENWKDYFSLKEQ